MCETRWNRGRDAACCGGAVAARVFVSGGAARAVAVARAHPATRVDCFEPTWERVDLGREVAARLGLSARVRVWHDSALPVACRVLGAATARDPE